MAEVDVAAVYEAHVEHVWRSLHRLGVPAADLPDLVQDVFVVVFRRRREHDPARGSMRAWLWGICVGLARNHRRRASHSRMRLDAAPDAIGGGDPERALVAARRLDRGLRALEALDLERRAVFVMFEVEGMSGREIAATLGVPIGTVHSRLHAARAELARALAEEEDGT